VAFRLACVVLRRLLHRRHPETLVAQYQLVTRIRLRFSREAHTTDDVGSRARSTWMLAPISVAICAACGGTDAAINCSDNLCASQSVDPSEPSPSPGGGGSDVGGSLPGSGSGDASTIPDATTGPDTGADAGHGEKDSDLPDTLLPDGGLPFGAACLFSSQCASGYCMPVGGQSSFCTQKCTRSAECPAGSGGCGPIGFCRK
jgi:hypothetical protein